jgi:nicotinate-nucleotide adenylyltransferase
MTKKKQSIITAAAAPADQSRSQKKFRVGIMGGTFDPIHYGHLLAAEQARYAFGLKRVVFVPSGMPPHKNDKTTAPSEDRYIMTALAIAANPNFRVSRVEISKKGPSYTFDTIQYFLKHFADRNPEIFFITGLDAVMEIHTWKRAEKILDHCTIIAATRPGYDTSRLHEILGPDFMEKIKILQASALAISSTDIRNRVAYGLPIKYLVPESVEQYISYHKLYQPSRH